MSGASINLQGLALNNATPMYALEIDFAVGQPAGIGSQRPMLLMGNMTTAGTATADTVIYGPDTPIQCQQESDVITLFGAGSELHRMFRRVVKIQQVVSIYFIAVTASSGTAATLTFTLLNVPTGNGNVRVWIDDEYVDTGFLASATLTSITAAIVANCNNKTYWAVTGAQATVTTSNDSVMFTAKIKGPRGNWHRGMALLTFSAGGTPNTTITNTTDQPFASGATADSNVTALTTILAKRYYYTVSAAEDATQFGALAAQMTSSALALAGLRQRAFGGSSDTLSNVQTVATGINNPRCDILWMQTSPIVPSELAAIAASVYAQGEMSGSKPICNYNFYGNGPQDTWPVIPSRVAANIPTATSITSCLNNGVTPVGVNANGTTYLVKAITTRSLNGANNDYRIRDHHKVTICDFFGDDLLAKFSAQFAKKNLSDDPPAGSTNAPPSGDTVTPNRVRDCAFRLITDYGEAPAGSNLLVNTAQTKAASVFQREKPANNNRISAQLPLQTIDTLDQIASLLEQVA
jgi:phage tail sheath gpL-like